MRVYILEYNNTASMSSYCSSYEHPVGDRSGVKGRDLGQVQREEYGVAICKVKGLARGWAVGVVSLIFF